MLMMSQWKSTLCFYSVQIACMYRSRNIVIHGCTTCMGTMGVPHTWAQRHEDTVFVKNLVYYEVVLNNQPKKVCF